MRKARHLRIVRRLVDPQDHRDESRRMPMAPLAQYRNHALQGLFQWSTLRDRLENNREFPMGWLVLEQAPRNPIRPSSEVLARPDLLHSCSRQGLGPSRQTGCEDRADSEQRLVSPSPGRNARRHTNQSSGRNYDPSRG